MAKEAQFPELILLALLLELLYFSAQTKSIKLLHRHVLPSCQVLQDP